MNNVRKLGVCLTGEPGDKAALAFASLLSRAVEPAGVCCIHAACIESTTEAKLDAEVVREQIRTAFEEGSSVRSEVRIVEASGLHRILRIARDCDLDMLVIGRRLPNDQLGVGSMFYRLARKAPCDVLLTPAGSYPHLNRLLVLVDGSEHSKLALERAIDLARRCGGKPQVLAHSVYMVPSGYHHTGKTLEETIRCHERLQRKLVEPLVAAVDTSGVDFDVVYTCTTNTAATAHDLASAGNMDAIVIGSRGATLPAIALLGGTTERVVLNSAVPVLVVKRKGETFRFLDAVLETIQAPGQGPRAFEADGRHPGAEASPGGCAAGVCWSAHAPSARVESLHSAP